MKLRKRYPINYYEPQEPSFDDYVYCDHCADFVYEYCSIHGGLLVIPDEKVPDKPPFPSFVPRAALTIPKVFLHLARSIIPGAGLGVFTTLTLPRGVRFGPFRGRSTTEVESTNCWQLHEEDRRKKGVVDATDPNSSNWMRYVNCARHWREQNLVAYQYQGQIYYRTIKIVPRFTELLVFYGGEFAHLLKINLKRYDDPQFYPTIQANSPKAVKILRQPTEVLLSEDVTEIPNYEDKTELKHQQDILDKDKDMEVDTIEDNFVMIEDDSLFHEDDSLFHEDETQENDSYSSTPTVEYDEENETFNINFFNSSDNNNLRSKSAQKYTCNICNKNFLTSYFLTKHLELGHNTTCQICNFKSNSRQNLIRHLSRVHRPKNEIQPKPNTYEKPLQNCYLCDKTYFNKSSLRLHLKRDHSLKPKKCARCKFVSYSDVSLQNHMKIHTEAAVMHECDKCSYKSPILGYLKNHLRRFHKIRQ